MHSESLVLLLSFIAIVVIAIAKFSKIFLSTLDSYTGQITAAINESEAIKADAIKMLDEINKKKVETEKQIEDIIFNANKEADKILKNGIEKIDEELKERLKISEKNLILIKKEMISDFKKTSIANMFENIKSYFAKKGNCNNKPVIDDFELDEVMMAKFVNNKTETIN
jgi:F0F1-type ATP synthase membrane subunit b/b'